MRRSRHTHGPGYDVQSLGVYANVAQRLRATKRWVGSDIVSAASFIAER